MDHACRLHIENEMETRTLRVRQEIDRTGVKREIDDQDKSGGISHNFILLAIFKVTKLHELSFTVKCS